jgi:hypothetical protein
LTKDPRPHVLTCPWQPLSQILPPSHPRMNCFSCHLPHSPTCPRDMHSNIRSFLENRSASQSGPRTHLSPPHFLTFKQMDGEPSLFLLFLLLFLLFLLLFLLFLLFLLLFLLFLAFLAFSNPLRTLLVPSTNPIPIVLPCLPVSLTLCPGVSNSST